MAQNKAVKSRNWVTIVYPESCKPNWEDIINDLQICWAHSPLHQFDTNIDGEAKKPHYHVIMTFESNKSYQQIKEICDSIGAANPFVALSLRGAARYFCHMDNPEKYQYNFEDCYTHGLDLNELCKCTITEAHITLRDILTFCKQNDIDEYSDLIDYTLEYNMGWFDLLAEKYTLFLSSYLASARGRKCRK